MIYKGMKTHKIGNLEIQYKDLINPYDHKSGIDWDLAEKLLVKTYGEGWRLPTIQEIRYIMELGDMGILSTGKRGRYWTREETDLGHAKYVIEDKPDRYNNRFNIWPKNSTLRIRGVKDI